MKLVVFTHLRSYCETISILQSTINGLVFVFLIFTLALRCHHTETNKAHHEPGQQILPPGVLHELLSHLPIPTPSVIGTRTPEDRPGRRRTGTPLDSVLYRLSDHQKVVQVLFGLRSTEPRHRESLRRTWGIRFSHTQTRSCESTASEQGHTKQNEQMTI